MASTDVVPSCGRSACTANRTPPGPTGTMESLRDDTALFSKGDLSHALRAKEDEVRKGVERYDAEQFLGTPEADLVEGVVRKHAVAPVLLPPDKTTMKPVETTIEVRRLPDAFHYDLEHGPRIVAGTKFPFVVPFEGDAWLLLCAPNTRTLNPPRGTVAQQGLVLSFISHHPDGARIKAEFDAQLESIEGWLRHSTNMVNEHNKKVRSIATQAIQARREQLLKARQTSESMGYPTR